ncbi:MAG: 3-oxoacyl-ACP reductase FabG [Acidobacteriota bacterium]
MTESNPVALVTGGSRGIGRAIVEELAQAGWKVAFTYLGQREAADSLLSELADASRFHAVQADVRDFERSGEVVAETQTRLGPIDLLVNNAGVRQDEPLYRMSLEAWNLVIDTNLKGTFNYLSSVSLDIVKRQTGSIVIMVSVSGILGLAGQANYAASKAGVIGLTKSLSREVARFNVRVNAVAPGFIQTDMLEGIPELTLKRLYAQISSGRPGTPQQVAKVVRFLAGPEAEYITGQVLPVDGGMV